jgi:fluoroquinolone resistance protein
MMKVFSDDDWLYESTTVTGLDRPGQELPAVEFYESTLRAARLGSATLRRWLFEDCHFEACDLSNATLSQCTFQRCTFHGCRLVGVDWRQVSALSFNVEFHECSLSLSNFSGMSLMGLNCVDSDLSEVDFTEADLRNATFGGSELAGAIFQQTRLENTDLSFARNEEIDPLNNRITGLKLSMAGAIRLVERLGVTVPGSP